MSEARSQIGNTTGDRRDADLCIRLACRVALVLGRPRRAVRGDVRAGAEVGKPRGNVWGAPFAVVGA